MSCKSLARLRNETAVDENVVTDEKRIASRMTVREDTTSFMEKEALFIRLHRYTGRFLHSEDDCNLIVLTDDEMI